MSIYIIFIGFKLEDYHMVLNEYRYTHISKSDGVPLSVLRIEPDENCKIKGIVQLVHGMCEHKERYVAFMKYLAENGYITVIHDHRGHGESVRSKNEYGYFYKGGYEALIEDIHEITLETKQYAENERGVLVSGKEGVPFILLGHSMGSLAVRCYIKQYDSNNIVIFEGEFINGEKNGFGKEYNNTRTLIFEGRYLDGMKNGNGIEYHYNKKIKFQG